MSFTVRVITLLAVAAGLLAPAGALAAKRVPSTTSSITLNVPAGTTPHHGDRVSFTIATTVTSSPFVRLRCFRNGVVIYDAREGYFATALDDGIFTLASNGWTSGAADCTAALEQYVPKRRSWKVLASTTFHVDV